MADDQKRRTLLLSAFACKPEHGSEPGIGWGTLTLAAAIGNVVLLTSDANREYIGDAIDRLKSVEVHYVRAPFRLAQVGELGWRHRIDYLTWQLAAYRRAKVIVRTRRIDLIHHVTYGVSWMPSLLSLLNAPFVWSAGGIDTTPWRFFSCMALREGIREAARTILVRTLAFPVRVAMARQATLVLTTSDPSRFANPSGVRRHLQGGISAEDASRLQNGRSHCTPQPFRLLSVGRLVGLKGHGLALDAFARMQRALPDSEYWIVGDGPQRRWLEKRARALGCEASVKFLGELSRSEALRLYRDCDAFVHLSFHESFGYAVVEAMAAGLPVVCLKHGAPAVLVDSSVGFAIEPKSPGQVVSEVAAILLELASHPEIGAAIGSQAADRVASRWVWGLQVDVYRRLYSDALARK